MTLRPRGTPWVLPSLLLLVAACGDDVRPPAAGTDAGPRADGGPRDGGRLDGAPADGALPDGALPDGAPIDGGGGACTFSFDPALDAHALATDSVNEPRRVPVAASTSGFAVVWTQTEIGIRNVVGRVVLPTGRVEVAQNLTDDASRSIDPTAVGLGSGYVIAWVDNTELNYEVFAKAVSSDLTGGTARRVTDDPLRDDSPSLVGWDGGLLISWVRANTLGHRIAYTRRLDATGAPSAAEDAVTASPLTPGAPVLARRSGGGALVWAENRAGDSDVLLLRLDESGAESGEPVVLNTENDAEGTVDVALGVEGGAAVFGVAVAGVRPEVRFVALTPAGARDGDEIPLTVAPETGRDASIAAFGGGYVVAYRALTGEGLTEPTLRVRLLSGAGEPVDTLDLVPVQAAGGRTSVAVAPGGDAIYVSWADPEGGETRIRGARIGCD